MNVVRWGALQLTAQDSALSAVQARFTEQIAAAFNIANPANRSRGVRRGLAVPNSPPPAPDVVPPDVEPPNAVLLGGSADNLVQEVVRRAEEFGLRASIVSVYPQQVLRVDNPSRFQAVVGRMGREEVDMGGGRMFFYFDNTVGGSACLLRTVPCYVPCSTPFPGHDVLSIDWALAVLARFALGILPKSEFQPEAPVDTSARQVTVGYGRREDPYSRRDLLGLGRINVNADWQDFSGFSTQVPSTPAPPTPAPPAPANTVFVTELTVQEDLQPRELHFTFRVRASSPSITRCIDDSDARRQAEYDLAREIGYAVEARVREVFGLR